MKTLYHLTVLPPKLPQAEALSQEISALRSHFGGDLLYLNPNLLTRLYIPRLLFGFHRLRGLWQRERELDLHHFYNPDAFPFPILRCLRRPVLYTISSGVSAKRLNVGYFSRLAAVAVADERSLKLLQAAGIENSVLVTPGIDTNRFSHNPLPLDTEIRLLIASAPWTKAQFRSKGVDALLEAAQQAPHLRLIFLWRGVLAEEMRRRVAEKKLAHQVTVLNKVVDVNRMLAEVHATITLATTPGIIKSYPHSLLDSLAAGKPVLVSHAIPMADYVSKTGCGQVVTSVTPSDILTALETLASNYQAMQAVAQRVGQHDFSQQAMISSYQSAYSYALGL